MKSSTISNPDNRQVAARPPRPHIYFLDGIRGLAALYVVMYHAYTDCIFDIKQTNLYGLQALETNWLQFGHISVSIFIVLSGFCLSLPLMRLPYKFDILVFIKRRAHRILPPYYSALLITLLLTFAIPALRRPTHGNWDFTQPAFTWGAIVSHLLLIQDMSTHWIFKISHPLWTVALEWQIYFVFALVMVPIWRRFGMPIVLVLMFVVGSLLDRFRVADNCSHYLLLFAFGMFGAQLQRSSQAPGNEQWKKLPWSWIAAISAAVFLAESRGSGIWLNNHVTIADMLVGTAAIGTILYCDAWLADHPEILERPFIIRLFASRFAVSLGFFSYSIYLIHAPILALVYTAIMHLHVIKIEQVFLEETFAVPLSVVVAYGFYLCFERPFLNTKPILPLLGTASVRP